MKFAVVLCALVSLAIAAPQPRKVFHEHFDDFLDTIQAEIGDQLDDLLEQYMDSEEFRTSLEYMRTQEFKDLIFEMESLPEFKAVEEYLTLHKVDIYCFIDTFNGLLDSVTSRKARQTASGQDFDSFTRDVIDMLPRDKLAALFNEKVTKDPDFAAASQALQSIKFSILLSALWADPTFLAEVQLLSDHGIDAELLLAELRAIFGQQ